MSACTVYSCTVYFITKSIAGQLYIGSSKLFKFVDTSHAGGIIAAVCTCQLEVILVAIVTGLIVHFVTKHVLQHKTSSNQDRSGNTAEPFNPVQNDDATYDTACLGDPNGENVKMQPSPAYQAIPECL